jgi:hypothetical protein
MRFTRVLLCSLLTAHCSLLLGCGYTTRPGLAAHLRTVYVKPFINKIDLTQLTNDYQRFPIYRPAMESDVTNAVIRRFQFTGLMRIASPEKADSRIEGELLEFRRDALRYDASQNVEEWRLSVVVNARFYDFHVNQIVWEESRLTGDATYFATGPNAESEAGALDRAVQDLARRVVERTVENW